MLLALIFCIAMFGHAQAAERFSYAFEFGRDGVGASKLDSPWRMAINPLNGDIAVADSAKHRVAIFREDGSYKTSLITSDTDAVALQTPCAVAYDPLTDEYYVSDIAAHRIVVFSASGTLLRWFGMQGSQPGQFIKPAGVAVMPEGRILVADSGNDRIQMLARDGTFISAFGSKGSQQDQFNTPYDVAVNAGADRIAIADYGNHRVALYDQRGKLVKIIGEFGTKPGQFWGASGVAFAADNTLIVADAANRRIQWFHLTDGSSGAFGQWGEGPGEFVQAHAVAANSKRNRIFASDFYLHRIQAFEGSGDAPATAGGNPWFALAGLAVSVLAVPGIFWLRRHRDLQLRRPAIPALLLLLAASVIMAAVFNTTLWSEMAVSSQGRVALTPTDKIAAMALFACIHFIVLALLIPRMLIKPVVFLLLIIAAIASFYMQRYHIYLDVPMLQNVLNTNRSEAGEQLSRPFLFHMAMWIIGLLALLAIVKLHKPTLAQSVRQRLVWSAVACIFAMGAWLITHKSLRAIRQDKPLLINMINPASGIVSLFRALHGKVQTNNTMLQPIATDARMSRNAPKARVLVLAIGESTRAASWGLNGYARDTTPELRKRRVVNFSDVTSCGSNTLTSVPCMFSPLGRARYDIDQIQRSENLLHVLQRIGVYIEWVDNSGGCIGVCRGVPTRNLAEDLPKRCGQQDCFDDALVESLDKILRHVPPGSDVVIGLHMAGSHGPAYHKRYPPEFERFQPACKRDDVRGCDDASTRNAYDNTVLYADHVLASFIDTLAAHTELDSALIFTSDHGESLGEGGIYMHGTPYPIAPREQIKVPMVFWASQGFAAQAGLDMDCLHARSAQPESHDSLFHTTLGLFGVATKEYLPKSDWSAACRATATPQ